MKKLGIGLAIGAVLSLGSFGALAKVPAPPAQSDAEKAVAAEKAKLAAASEAQLLGKYQDMAVANHRKNQRIVDKPVAAANDKDPK